MRKYIICIFVLFSFLQRFVAQNVGEYRAYLVSNAHLDTQWNWDVQTTIKEFILNTANQNLYLLDKYPNYVFNWEGAVRYQWLKEYYPMHYERIKDYVRQGRWHISGSSWDANDTNIPSPESTFRNILLAQEFYKKEFGVKSTDIFLPDCFGFSWTLPTIANHAGLIGFSTQKIAWRKHSFFGERKEPFSVGLWKGVDGTELLSALDCGVYVYDFPQDNLVEDKELIKRMGRAINGVGIRYFGAGDKGGSPSISSVEALENNLNKQGTVKIVSSTSDQLFKDYQPLSSHPELPVYNGELLMDVHGTGCYTSQGAMKRFNRRNEQLGDAAEKSSVIADWLGGMAYPAEELNNAWKRFIWHQFHDDLTGTSTQRSYTFSWNDEIISQSQFTNIIKETSGIAALGLNTMVKGIPLVAYNPIAYSRQNLIEASIPLPANMRPDIVVYNQHGKKMPTQIINVKNGVVHILFSAELAPVSYTVFDVRFESNKKTSINLKVEENTIENSIYKISLDANGDISSLIDKRINKELVENGKAIRLALFTENKSDQWPAWEIHKKTIDRSPVAIGEDVKISIEEKGPVCASLKVERKYKTSTIIQKIRLTDGVNDDRIDIITDIDWELANSLLKAEFPFSFSNPEATYDLGIGAIKRKTNTEKIYEVCAQHWADLTASDESYGVTILNDCKYGWDKPTNNTLRLTLLHIPDTEKRYKYQSTQDFGHHHFTYSIIGHSKALDNAGTVRKGEELNQPVISFIASKHTGKLGKDFSFVNSSTPQVAIKMLKKAENGDGYIIRVYETQGKNIENAQLTFCTEIESASETNACEEVINKALISKNKLIINMEPYRPKTFHIKLKEPVTAITPAIATCINIPFNTNGISSDAFIFTSNVDDKNNSYAAELIPSTLISGGIPFQMGKEGYLNVLKCKNDTIELPTDKPYNKIYILAAATDVDRHATFLADNHVHEFDIPYYSDFYAQWGLKDVSEGYVKNGVLAHIGEHRHNKEEGNQPYVFTYIYKLCIDIKPGTKTLQLPNDPNVAIFAITASVNLADDIKLAMEPRALPVTTKVVKYKSAN